MQRIIDDQLPLFCPVYHSLQYRFDVNGIHYKCRSCRQVHFYTYDELRQQAIAHQQKETILAAKMKYL